MQVSGLRTPSVSARIQHAPSEINAGSRPIPVRRPDALGRRSGRSPPTGRTRRKRVERAPPRASCAQVHRRYILALTCQYSRAHDTCPYQWGRGAVGRTGARRLGTPSTPASRRRAPTPGVIAPGRARTTSPRGLRPLVAPPHRQRVHQPQPPAPLRSLAADAGDGSTGTPLIGFVDHGHPVGVHVLG